MDRYHLNKKWPICCFLFPYLFCCSNLHRVGSIYIFFLLKYFIFTINCLVSLGRPAFGSSVLRHLSRTDKNNILLMVSHLAVDGVPEQCGLDTVMILRTFRPSYCIVLRTPFDILFSHVSLTFWHPHIFFFLLYARHKICWHLILWIKILVWCEQLKLHIFYSTIQHWHLHQQNKGSLQPPSLFHPQLPYS